MKQSCMPWQTGQRRAALVEHYAEAACRAAALHAAQSGAAAARMLDRAAAGVVLAVEWAIEVGLCQGCALPSV